MNTYEKEKLREHWQKPGMLSALLRVLPMVPFGNGADVNSRLKRVVSMTGISYRAEEMAQVYYMLEEDGHIIRDGEPPAPAAYMRCMHRAQGNCIDCHYEIGKRGNAAAIRYRLAQPVTEH